MSTLPFTCLKSIWRYVRRLRLFIYIYGMYTVYFFTARIRRCHSLVKISSTSEASGTDDGLCVVS